MSAPELCSFVFDAEGVRIEGRGVVKVTGGPPADTAGAICAFLDAMDPVTLEREAMQRLDWVGDDEMSFTSALLSVLKDTAAGKIAVQ